MNKNDNLSDTERWIFLVLYTCAWGVAANGFYDLHRIADALVKLAK
jgi:hypothetical protein